VIPAIDLRGGRVVRLRQGDFTREQIYADDPVQVARGFAEAGAARIHVVDLDGARFGEPQQASSIRAIVSALRGRGPKIQTAGGLRSADAIAQALDLGADCVVLGTAAVMDPDLVARAIDRHGPERIVVALDVRDGIAVGEGWTVGAAGRPVDEAIDVLNGTGVATVAVTAIGRDGMLGGPDVELLTRVIARTDAAVLASGGMRSIADLEAVRAIGARGAIVGRAIYEGAIDVAGAIEALRTPS